MTPQENITLTQQPFDFKPDRILEEGFALPVGEIVSLASCNCQQFPGVLPGGWSGNSV